MRVRIGSDKYFQENLKELNAVKGLSQTKQNKRWENFKIAVRKLFNGKGFKEKFKDSIDAKKLGFTSSEKADTELYNKEIDDYVAHRKEVIVNKAFKKFKEDVNPILDLAETLSSSKYSQDLQKHLRCSIALLGLRGSKKKESCQGFEQLKAFVEHHESNDPKTDFDLKIEELKVAFESEAYSKNIVIFIHYFTGKTEIAALAPFLKVEEETNKTQIDFLIDLELWAKKMKEQRVTLVQSMPPEYKASNIGQYGYFSDQIAEVKRISQIQLQVVSRREQLDRSVANFIIDQLIKPVVASQAILNRTQLYSHPVNLESKIGTESKEIEKAKKALKETLPSDESNYPIAVENVRIRKKNKKVLKVVHNIVSFNFLVYITPLEKKLASYLKQVEKAENKDGRVSSHDVRKLIKLSAAINDLTEEIKIARKKFILINDWDLFVVAQENSVQLESNATEKEKLDAKVQAKRNIEQINDLINQTSEHLNKIEDLVFDKGALPFNEWIEKLPELKNDSENKLAEIESLSAAMTRVDGLIKKAEIDPLKKVAADINFLQSVQSFDVEESNDGPDSLYEAVVLANLGHEFNSVAVLQAKVHEWLKENPIQISEYLKKDIRDYVKVNSPHLLIVQKAPDFRPIYEIYREASTVVPTWEADLDRFCASDDMQNRYLFSMQGNRGFPGNLELLALQELLKVHFVVNASDGKSEVDANPNNNPVINLALTQHGSHFDYLKPKSNELTP